MDFLWVGKDSFGTVAASCQLPLWRRSEFTLKGTVGLDFSRTPALTERRYR